MIRFTTLLVPTEKADDWAEWLAQQRGVLGTQELPADGAPHFLPDLAHHFVAFEHQQAFNGWLRSQSWRTARHVRLKVWHSDPLKLPFRATVLESGIEPRRNYLAAARHRHRGRCIGPFWVGPPWRDPTPRKIPIRLVPGTAFGLGDHPTTQLCLEMLATRCAPVADVLDFGAGTGVLAIAARRWFNRCRTWLVEPDRHCWPEIQHNFRLNHLRAPQRIYRGLPPGAFDLVLANVYLQALVHLLRQLTRGTRVRLRRGGRLIVSGLLGAEQRDEFLRHADAAGWRLNRHRRRDHWFALELTPPEN